MSRNVLIAAVLSLLAHAGVAFSGYLFPEDASPPPAETEVPTIALDLPPPPEPDEPEIVENTTSDTPADISELAPPMQNDLPSAVIDSPFVQQIQAPPPPGLNRPTGAAIVLPSGPPRPSAGSGLKNVFNLADLDEPPRATVRPLPAYPFEMRRSGLKGEVVVEFIVDTQGNVRDPFIVRSSHPGFEQAALDVVLKWKFKPGKKGGASQNTRVRQPLTFNLNQD
jgi:periplasmic protein TonB